MYVFGIFAVMIAVGALIGAVTNHFAIKMLFRPYKAIYIFGKRVPFTPGLIPKRRDELARQMGQMVTGHLLTTEGLKKRLASDAVKSQAVQVGERLLARLSQSTATVEEALESIGISNPAQKADRAVSRLADEKLSAFLEAYENEPLKKLFPLEAQEKLKEKIPMVSSYILSRAVSYFESDEGKERLGHMIDDFLKERGMLGSMVQMFLGNSSLVDRVQPEIVKFLKNGETAGLLQDLLENEWDKLKEYTFKEADDKWNLKPLIFDLKEKLLKRFSLQPFFEKTIGSSISSFEQDIALRLPQMADRLLEEAGRRLDQALKQLELEQIVKEQVDNFPVERLEEMVLSISKREFKMITYLGGLLGGIIGAVQAIFVILI
ncbi:DUF445 family protein [Bacillus sp. FSL W8-0445]|jgi:uncharacterized membrane protein YheB (UPF0754 family)|uniref:Uncharacterized protein n=1 Tax=Bacillus licheniformis TaxID=1402 RepID=A0A415J099_BACLI|nr:MULTISPECIES: DUF445 family protein [Bacillus]MDP4081399.1 DUF445 family protein [Bacillota bacterium]AKQ72232.1 YheB protein [Bacillus licheniformis WX-02]AMR09617.1 hypothetical protein AB684_05335 [Bacillus licheniformis]APJ26245.1 hypothetical protein BSZ43_05320 [Bacillus sp. H15-1]ARC66302.1 hypothetical protein B14_03305 [Bacillus licheniformis]